MSRRHSAIVIAIACAAALLPGLKSGPTYATHAGALLPGLKSGLTYDTRAAALLPGLKSGPTYDTRAAALLPGLQPGPAYATGADPRLGPLRDLDSHFPFKPSASPQAWRERAAALRRQVRVALGLWPWPSRTPLNAVVHGAVQREGYTVERVFFESVPGHFVTGSLYRPAGRTGRLPAVLSPHGHWPGGRFQDVAEDDRRRQLASGAERFDTAARHVLQARAVQLTRMGAVVFLYDMVGYADSVQIPQPVAHSPRGRQRQDADGLFFSVGAEHHLQSILGLQVWNAVRALDFVTSLHDVDPARLAVTGASGGATQTFLLAAIDERPAVIFPAVMVSARMQGGCTCENANFLRVGTGNVELAALFAPKPLGMTAADDWTRTMPSDGFPQLRRHYAMLGAADRVELFPFLQFGHNYNHVSRTAMYGWLNRHLGLGQKEPVLEGDFVPLTREQATVWHGPHRAPDGGPAHERALTSWLRDDARRQMAALIPRDSGGMAAWRDLMGGAVAGLMARPVPQDHDVTAAIANDTPPGGPRPAVLDLQVVPHGEHVRALTWAPAGSRGVTVVVSSRGVAGLTGADGSAGPLVARLLSARQTVVAVDAIGAADGAGHAAKNRLVPNRSAAAFTFGYNAPLVVQRAHDTLAALRYARSAAGSAGHVALLATDGAASAWAVLARAQAGPLVDAAALLTGGFRFASVASLDDPSFLPGAVKYGDVPALVAAAAPSAVWLGGEDERSAALARDVYRSAGSPLALTLSATSGERGLDEAVGWLVSREKK